MSTNATNQVALIGWDSFAERVLEQLLAAGLPATIILRNTRDQEHLEASYGQRVSSLVVPDLNDFKLMEALLSQSRVILVNLEDDQEKLIYVVNLRKRFPNIKIVAPVTNPHLNETFVSAAEVLPLSKEEVSGKIFASYLFEPDVAEYLNDLLSPAQSDDEHDIQEHQVPAGHAYVGRPYGDLFVELNKAYNAVLIGLSRQVGVEYKLHKNPPNDTTVEAGDYLILVLSGSASAALEREVFGSGPG